MYMYQVLQFLGSELDFTLVNKWDIFSLKTNIIYGTYTETVTCFFFSFEDKRVIIRQGHMADNFYLIISGTGRDHFHIRFINFYIPVNVMIW